MLNYLSKINADEKKKIVYLPTEMGCLKLTYYDNDMGALRKKFFFLHGVLRKRYAEEKKRLDYYPFGMAMPGRSFSSNQYRYGFNGQEKDDEVSGSGNSYTAMFWQYDSRLGRRWNQDPKPNPSISNYATFANNPIFFTDILGDTVRNKHIANIQGKSNSGNSRLGESVNVGEYNVVPFYDTKTDELIGYNAGREDSDGDYRTEYQLDAGDLTDFEENISTYTAAANLFYINGVPDEGILQMAAGNVKEGLSTQWKGALTSLEFYEPSPRFARGAFKMKGSLSGYNKFVSKNKYSSGSHRGKGSGSASKSYGKDYKAALKKQTSASVKNINRNIDAANKNIKMMSKKNKDEKTSK